MQLPSLPTCFRAQQSPMSHSDSPFPPLKTEHRYRGVYERAGFDVCYRSTSDSKSIYLKRSRGPMSPTMQQPGPRIASESSLPNGGHAYTSANTSSRSLPQLAPVLSHGEPLPFSTRTVNNSYNTGAPSVNTRGNASGPYGFHSAPLSAVTYAPQDQAERFQLPKRGQRQDQTQHSQPLQFEPFQPVKKAPAMNGAAPQFKQDGERNVKNLCLHIPNSNFSPAPVTNQGSTDSFSEKNSPDSYESGEFKQQTPETSAGSSRDFGRKQSTSSDISVKTSELTSAPYPINDGLNSADKDLSEVLNDFRSEVEQHKKYDPRSREPRTATHKLQLQPLSSDDLNESSYDDSSFRFNSARQSNETDDTTNEEFQSFLKTSANPQNNSRNSHLSTISSIISKPHNSDDEDADVDEELERQLESLKTGSDSCLVLTKRSKDSDSFVTANNTLRASSEQELPSFKIDGASQFSDREDSDSDTETEYEKDEKLTEQEVDLNECDDEVAPLSFRKNVSHAAFDEPPQTPVTKNGAFEEDLETPETIKPLSPKNHRVEEELKNINFKGAESPQLTERDIRSLPLNYNRDNLDLTRDKEDEKEILLHNPTPREFDAFPKSVVGMDIPTFRESTPSFAPGEGPCRVCSQTVDKAGRGDQKAIYSKNSELSGQWHRGCFSCAYVGCDVKFSKHVACYILLDNAFCHDHYHTLNGTRCQSCHQGIEGECIENELKQKWHVSCLKCWKCSTGIKSDYFLINNEIFCEEDAAKEILSMERNGLSTTDKIEKRRTRMLFLDQQHAM